jgi:hypothetical protein
MSGFIYVASPYSHPQITIEEARHAEVMRYVAKLLNRQEWCYSPILHCHTLAITHCLPRDAASWKDYNETMMRAANELHVLMLDGWRRSLGIKHEMDFWNEHFPDRPLYMVAPEPYASTTA